MDIIFQITTKCATVPKFKLFHQLNTPLTRIIFTLGANDVERVQVNEKGKFQEDGTNCHGQKNGTLPTHTLRVVCAH